MFVQLGGVVKTPPFFLSNIFFYKVLSIKYFYIILVLFHIFMYSYYLCTSIKL